MHTRRIVLQSAFAAATAALMRDAVAAAEKREEQAGRTLPPITKAIPSTGEELPVIGLGTNAYGVSTEEEIATRREVLRHMSGLGGKVIDTARAYGESEAVIGRLFGELGNRNQYFLATKTPIRGDVQAGVGELDEALRRLRTDRIDLMQIHNFHELDTLFPRLREWKQAGKVRYIGVSTSSDHQYPQMLEAIRKLPLDFIQVDYSIDNRGSEEQILPAARDKGLAVLGNVPLGGRRGNVLPKVAHRPLPDWAAEMDATSWAQVLLKYNVSHPAITAVIPGTTKLAHLEDNQLAGRGRLPDAAMRKKLEEFWATV
jgi:aryl-alcohol dehydrogenase-like predicted oxidoreductase